MNWMHRHAPQTLRGGWVQYVMKINVYMLLTSQETEHSKDDRLCPERMQCKPHLLCMIVARVQGGVLEAMTNPKSMNEEVLGDVGALGLCKNVGEGEEIKPHRGWPWGKKCVVFRARGRVRALCEPAMAKSWKRCAVVATRADMDVRSSGRISRPCVGEER